MLHYVILPYIIWRRLHLSAPTAAATTFIAAAATTTATTAATTTTTTATTTTNNNNNDNHNSNTNNTISARRQHPPTLMFSKAPQGNERGAIELCHLYPYPCPKKFYKLPAVLFYHTNLFYKLAWAWAWV